MMAYQHPFETLAEEIRRLILEGITELKKPVDIPIIARAFQISEPSAETHLETLVNSGQLRRIKNRPGFYEVPPETQETLF